MKFKKLLYPTLAFAAIAFSLNSCKPDTNSCDNCETELITTLNVQLTDSATGTVSHYIFRDLDGDGANAPVQFDTLQLLANHTYNASFFILDESKTPADTTSNQILEEGNDHQFFYHPTGINVSFTYNDHDSHTPPMPIGLQSKWYVGAATGNGKIEIVLKHQPGIKDGNEATGEVDLDVTYNAVVH
jgi:hypothetical protein